jgi:hypothetical protein
MSYFILKAAISGVLVLVVSEISRRNPTFGGLIAALPLISVLSIVWLWRETGDVERIAAQSAATFWFVLPSLPMFALMPVMLRSSLGFWPSLLAGCAITIVLYFATAWLLSRFSVNL